MKKRYIKYDIGTAAEEDVYDHLLTCDTSFVPVLSRRIDISAYASKIKEKSVTFEAWSKGRLVGLIAAYSNDPFKKTVFITNVSVLKEFMGAGIATQLLIKCVNYASEHKFVEISLEVSKENKPAILFYRKNHFLETQVINDSIIMKRSVVLGNLF